MTATPEPDPTLMAAIRAAAGLPEPGISQFESLALHDTDDGLAFDYRFDFDGHSQYDKSVGLRGRALRRGGDGWQVRELALVHRGEAANFALPAAVAPPPSPGAATS